MAMGEGGVGDGGPAFPGEKAMRFGQTNDCNEGMTLRDYFASKAISGMMGEIHSYGQDISPDTLENYAKSAYRLADALLAARGGS